MRKTRLVALAGFGLFALTPAHAVGLGDLAKVVLGGGSILKKGKAKCGSALGLTSADELKLTFARAAAERALPISEFLAIDKASNAEADKAAESTTFCPETKAKKKGLLSKIGKAAKGLAGKGLGI